MVGLENWPSSCTSRTMASGALTKCSRAAGSGSRMVWRDGRTTSSMGHGAAETSVYTCTTAAADRPTSTVSRSPASTVGCGCWKTRASAAMERTRTGIIRSARVAHPRSVTLTSWRGASSGRTRVQVTSSPTIRTNRRRTARPATTIFRATRHRANTYVRATTAEPPMNPRATRRTAVLTARQASWSARTAASVGARPASPVVATSARRAGLATLMRVTTRASAEQPTGRSHQRIQRRDAEDGPTSFIGRFAEIPSPREHPGARRV